MKNLFTILFLFSAFFVFGQGTQTVISTPNPGYVNRNALLKLPDDYATATSTRYPIMIFLHGLGECMNHFCWVLGTCGQGGNPSLVCCGLCGQGANVGGPQYYVNSNPTAMAGFVNPVTGATQKFIFLTPFGSPNLFPQWANNLNSILTYMISNYRVDSSRIYLTGLSQGGGGITYYVQHEGGFQPQYKVAAFVPMESYTDVAPTQSRANFIVADSVRAWGFGDDDCWCESCNPPTSEICDVHGVRTKDLINMMNVAKPGMGIFHTYQGGHCCWGNFYNPTFRKSITFTVGGVTYTRNVNIYEWCLIWQQGNILSSYAGPNQTLTVPTSSVNLAGSASSGRTPYSYLWTKQSGPSGQTITSPSAASTSVTGLVQGTYIFNLRVTDNIGTQANDQVQIIVNPNINQFPVADAGTDQTITLPTSTTTLVGSGTDAEGLVTYAWTLITGPSGSTIVSSTSATTNITGLVQGVYRFKLTVTDNSGQIDSDEITVNVQPASVCTPGGTRRYLAQHSGTKGVTFNGLTQTYYPGDTLVVNALLNPWSYIGIYNVHGTPSCPVVVINEGGQVIGTTIGTGTGRSNSGIVLGDCSNIHLTGTGSGDFYGFYVTTAVNGPTDPTHNGVGVSVSGLSSNIEIDHIDVYKKTYIIWVKNEASCNPALQYPSQRINNVKIHHTRGRNINQDGMYLGSTGSYGGRPITCSGVTIYPLPARLSNISVYDNILDSLNRTAIQFSAVDSGTNECYNNTITRAGFEWNNQQGAGITISGSWVNVYDNIISQTWIHGIFVLNTGIVTLDNNRVDSSGMLGGRRNIDTLVNGSIVGGVYSSSIVLHPKVGVPADSLRFYVRNNVLGKVMTKDSMQIIGVKDFKHLFGKVGNLLCGNTKIYYGGAPARDTIPPGVIFSRTGCSISTTLNICPVMSAGGDRTITLPINTTTIDGSGVDPDGATIAFSWSKFSGPASHTIVNQTSNSTQITDLVQGVYVFRLTATDDSSCVRTDDMQVIVNAPVVNQLPTSEAGANQAITLPTNSVSLVGSGTDFDGTISTYAWSKLSGPASHSFSAPSSASTNVNNLVEGTYVFQLLVTDNSGGQGTDAVTVVVNPAVPPPNQSPTANAGIDYNIQLPVNSITAIGSGTDNDGTISTYAWTKIAGPATFTIVSASNDTTDITGLVTGTYQFRLTVTDNQGATASDIMIVTVQAANLAPVAAAGIDQSIVYPPASSVALSGSGSSDPDGSVSSYLWSQWSGPITATIATPTTAGTNITGLTTAGVYVFRLQVTDNQGGVNTDDVQITVNANQQPLANTGGSYSVTLPTNSKTLVGSGSDIDGTITGYGWVKTSGPSGGAISSPTSSTTNITGLVEGNYEFTLTVTDNAGATHSSVATIRVSKGGLIRRNRGRPRIF